MVWAQRKVWAVLYVVLKKRRGRQTIKKDKFLKDVDRARLSENNKDSYNSGSWRETAAEYYVVPRRLYKIIGKARSVWKHGLGENVH